MDRQPRILVIRRDNIGDLICTTPLIETLRKAFPEGHICALANSYNRAVLTGNPDLDQVYWYTKAKHEESVRKKLASYVDRARLIHRLRSEAFDYAILATPSFQRHALKFARWIGARNIVGYDAPDDPQSKHISLPVPPVSSSLHEVQLVHRLLEPLGIDQAPGPLKLHPNIHARTRLEKELGEQGWAHGATIGIHISARKVSQRWPAASFIELIGRLSAIYPNVSFLLFWAPGSANDPKHPGDDEKADLILGGTQSARVFPVPTRELEELIAGISLVDLFICSDGGAMHIAAALSKPIVCFFGGSDVERWHPWKTPHTVLQAPDREVKSIPVDSVTEAITALSKLDGTELR